MYIYFTRSEYGVYGGGLNKPLTYLYRILSDRFQTEKIEFPYQEIEIQLAFLSPKIKDAQYLEWHGKLPIYYRGKNMIRVTLPVFEQESNLVDVFELLYKAFDIIVTKKKKGDFFDAKKIKSILHQLEQELQVSDLWELHSYYEALLRQETIERNRQGRTIREQSFAEKKRLIYDIRFYYRLDNIEKLYFSPYDNKLCDTILEKLREKKFRLPGYTQKF